MEIERFLPQYSVKFANMWCEIEGFEVPFKLFEAGLSSIEVCGEIEEELVFTGEVSAKLIFKHQEFKMFLTHVQTYPIDNYFIYAFKIKFVEISNFKKWGVFIKSIFGLYSKKSRDS